MSDHLLHLDSLEAEGYMNFRLECTHGPGGKWQCTTIDGQPLEPPDPDLCWLSTWWDDLNTEMIGDIDGPIVFPLPVKPCDEWDYEDGGTLVREEG